jgi:hypothetical protein
LSVKRERSARAFQVDPGSLPRDATDVIRLWQEGFPAFAGDRAPWRVENIYLANPAPEPAIALLRDASGDVVGVQTAIPHATEGVLGEARWGALADFMVSGEYRTLGPAMKLLRGTLSLAADSMDVIYSWSNARSAAVYGRAGLHPVCRSTIYRHPLHVADLSPTPGVVRRTRALAGLMDAGIYLWDRAREFRWARRFDFTVGDGVPADVDEVRARLGSLPFQASRRDTATLRWRFREALDNGEVRSVLARDGRTGECVGYVLLQMGGKTAAVVDFFTGGDPGPLAGLLTEVEMVARAGGASVVELEFVGSAPFHACIERAGFFPRESNAVHATTFRGPSPDWPEGVFMTFFDRDP